MSRTEEHVHVINSKACGYIQVVLLSLHVNTFHGMFVAHKILTLLFEARRYRAVAIKNNQFGQFLL